jgi:hypothetical protein
MTPDLPPESPNWLAPDAVRKLLGGYATGTLTPEERAALFAAALEDQELFNALAREQALLDHLRDPAARAELLAALDKPARAPFWQWLLRPAVAGFAVAGIVTKAVVAVWQSTRVPIMKQPPPTILAEARPPQLPLAADAPRARDAVPPQATAPLDRKTVAPRSPSPEAMSAPAPPPAPTRAAAPPPPPPQVQTDVAQGRAAEPEKAAKAERAFSNQFMNRAVPLSSGLAGSLGSLAMLPRCTVLRDSGEVEPATPLNPGETIRLRILAPAEGTVSVMESGQVLASGAVQRQQVFETPPLPFAGAGTRQISVTFSPPPPAAPIVVPLTLTYRQ